MKRLVIFLMLLLSSTVYAAGTYNTTVNNTDYQIVFSPGPFGPGEQGIAYVYANSVEVGQFTYVADYNGSVLFYDVKNFCWFYEIYDGATLVAFQPLNITLTKEQ